MNVNCAQQPMKIFLVVGLLNTMLASSAAATLQFALIEPCSQQTKEWCIPGSYEAGRRVSVLGHKSCVGTTSGGTTLTNDVEEYSGTKISFKKCPDNLNKSVALLDVIVRKYRSLSTPEITGSNEARELASRVEQTSEFKEHRQHYEDSTPEGSTWTVHKIKTTPAPIYTLVYNPARVSFFVLHGKGVARPFGNDPIGCNLESAFEVNSTSVLSLSCCIIDGDSCDRYFLVSPDFTVPKRGEVD